ncbi:hypothetical protein [Desulfuromonas sp. CSMB_57]|jgi:hypothetical protein|uniref:hypothetical protein n=1 Tax=Desulfuromonas sp. CSMB_57 TaxID=2807629 RepID=UPI001CD47939|nr:hypothetical protein [Desulfuromonas sp. CSMB_57]
MFRSLSAAFTGGILGALTVSLLYWELVRDGVTAWLGISLRLPLDFASLSQRLIIGGLWGLLLAPPYWKNRPVWRGLLAGGILAAWLLLYYLPRHGRGLGGTGYGRMTPVVLLAISLLWGLVAAFWNRQAAR